MPIERTFTIDRDLARRAERKLRRYGRTLDDALEYALTLVVTVRGLPDFAVPVTLDFTVDGKAMKMRSGARLVPFVEEAGGMFSARLDSIGLDAFAETQDALAAEVSEQLAMLWKEYALADDAELTESAQKVKRNLLATFEEVGRA